MPNSLRPSRLTRSCIAAIVGACAWSVAPLASAQSTPAAAPAPGQKPPCVPAASYSLGYDCELFPLPSLPVAATAPAAVGAVVAVVPVPVPGGAAVPAVEPAVEPPLAPSGVPLPAAGVPGVAVPTPTPPAEPAVAAATSAPTAPADSSSGGSPSHAPAYVAFAVGVGGVGMTVAFGILALQTKSTLSGECSSGNVCPASASSDVSTLKTDGILADVGLGVAAAGVALGAILFATEHGSSSTTGGLHVKPWIGLGAGGLKGSF
jgi:hypothetical protein